MARKKYTNGEITVTSGSQVTLNETIWPSVTEGWLLRNGFTPVEPEPKPQPTAQKIAQRERRAKKKEISMQIETEKNAIRQTDYVITKCMEAQLLSNPMPYDADYLEGIHIARKAHRDRINQLEDELQSLTEKEDEVWG